MKIRILDINTESFTIFIESDYGTFHCFYELTEKFIKNSVYYVELDIDQMFSFGDIKEANDTSFKIEGLDENRCKITAYVETVEDDLITVRVGYDLLMLEVKNNEDFYTLKGKFISFIANKVYIFDERLT